MPRTVDHIVETHRIARQRRTAGLPIWKYTLNVADVWSNEGMTFQQRRDAIVRRLRKSPWHRSSETVRDLTYELADSETPDEFNVPWDALYDEADYDRVWIKLQ